MRPPRSFALAGACVALLACLLAGCSALRLGYSNGEMVAYWWLNSYVDFDADQRPWVKEHIGKLFAWHRQTQLDDYARLLADGRQQLQRPVTPAEVAADIDVLKQRMLIVIDKALPALADLALSLQPYQIAHLEQKFASNNEKYRKEYLRGSLEDRQLHRYREVMKHAEYWFGNFSKEQEAQIRAASDARPLDNELVLAERMRRQQEMIALLKRIHAERPSRDATIRMLKDYLAATLEHYGNVQHRAYYDASLKGAAQMAALIINSATPEQKARAAKRAQQWIDDFHAMAKKASAAE